MSEIAKKEETLLPADPMVSMIERIAMDPNADIAKLERMLDMKERHEARQAKAEFDLSFAKASSEFPEIPLNGLNNHTNQPYALLKDIIGKTRPVLARYGFSLSFSTEVSERDVIVTAELAHQSGHSKRNSLPLPRDTGAGRNNVQAVGSSQTYGQRYTAQAILGLSLGEDTEDDGGSTGTPNPVNNSSAQGLDDAWEQAILDSLPDDPGAETLADAYADAIERDVERYKSTGGLDGYLKKRAGYIRFIEEHHPERHSDVRAAVLAKRDILNNRRS